MSDNTNYACAVGRIRVLETGLLKPTDLERLIGSKTASNAFRVLNDLDYAAYMEDSTEVHDFQKILNADLYKTKELLRQMAPYPELLNILWLRYDVHNIKTLLHAKWKGIAPERINNLLLEYGKFSPHLLERFILEDRDSERIPAYLEAMIRHTEEVYLAEKEDPFQANVYLEACMLKHIESIVKRERNPFITHLYLLSVDITNLKSSLRLLTREKEVRIKILDNTFIPGAHIAKDTIQSFLEKESVSQFTEQLPSAYASVVKDALETFYQNASFLDFEIELENIIIKYLARSKYIVFGPEPLFSYFLAKLNNSQIIRAILVGKLNDMAEAAG